MTLAAPSTTATLAEWLSYLEQLHPSAIDMGLERVRQVADRLPLQTSALKIVAAHARQTDDYSFAERFWPLL